MNKKIGMYGSIVNICAVTGFALCMLFGTAIGSYLVCMFIALSFIPLTCAFAAFSSKENKAAGYTSIIFAGAYAVFILLVYFGQLTAVRLNNLNEQATQILDYQKFGLFFSYDLLGYSLMALSTFFAGLTIVPKTKADKWLKALLLIHGIFFVCCIIMPMLGLFNKDLQGAAWIGTAILLFWCAYFVPVGVLSFLHFKKEA